MTNYCSKYSRNSYVTLARALYCCQILTNLTIVLARTNIPLEPFISLHNLLLTECMYSDGVFLFYMPLYASSWLHPRLIVYVFSLRGKCQRHALLKSCQYNIVSRSLSSHIFLPYHVYVCWVIFIEQQNILLHIWLYFFLVRAYLHNTFIWLHPCWPYFARPRMVM